jgi:hypothetical protein
MSTHLDDDSWNTFRREVLEEGGVEHAERRQAPAEVTQCTAEATTRENSEVGPSLDHQRLDLVHVLPEGAIGAFGVGATVCVHLSQYALEVRVGVGGSGQGERALSDIGLLVVLCIRPPTSINSRRDMDTQG